MQNSGASGDAMRILIADDHDLVRRGLRGLLGREPDLEIVGEARDGREAVELGLSLLPDLVLMDVRMPGMDGLEATRAIKGERPEIGVIIVTMHDDPDYMLEAIKAGAAGYVLKDASWEDLIASVRRALNGDFPMDPAVAARLLQRLVREAPEQPAPRADDGPPVRMGPSEPLTSRELEVLERMTLGHTNTGIAQDLTISVGTVKDHVQRVISKLGVSDRTQAAVRAVELQIVRPAS